MPPVYDQHTTRAQSTTQAQSTTRSYTGEVVRA